MIYTKLLFKYTDFYKLQNKLNAVIIIKYIMYLNNNLSILFKMLSIPSRNL